MAYCLSVISIVSLIDLIMILRLQKYIRFFLHFSNGKSNVCSCLYTLKYCVHCWDLGRYLSNPGLDHWIASKRVIRNFQRKKGYMLTYWRSDQLEIIRYTNFDFKGIWLQDFVTKVQIVKTNCNLLFQEQQEHIKFKTHKL